MEPQTWDPHPQGGSARRLLTVSEASCMPDMSCADAQGKYYEAAVTDIDPTTKVVSAAFPQHAGLEQHSFQVPYDILILSVGSVNNTFGIKVRHALHRVRPDSSQDRGPLVALALPKP